MPAEIKPWMREAAKRMCFTEGDIAWSANIIAEAFAAHEREQGELRRAAKELIAWDAKTTMWSSDTAAEFREIVKRLKAALASGGDK